jgi:RHS repeat-associated protein
VNQFLYRGEQLDPSFSMYYLRARYYVPRTGRFLTADRSESQVISACDCGINRTAPLEAIHHQFEYANADPINRLDPTGFEDIFDYEASSTPGIQNHHIIEQRLQPYLVETESKLVCILEAAVALAIPDHRDFTQALETRFHTRNQVHRRTVIQRHKSWPQYMLFTRITRRLFSS